jgi:hypothetical protein
LIWRRSGDAPPEDRPALERFVGGEVPRGDDKNSAKERARSRQALHVAEQAIEEAITQGDKSLILSLRQGRQGDSVEAIAPDAQRSDRGMSQGGRTAPGFGRCVFTAPRLARFFSLLNAR